MSDLKQKAEALKKAKTEAFFTACPSRLTELALVDLEAIEGNPKYIIDMRWVHTGVGYGDACSVCFAGAALANRLDAPFAEHWSCMPDPGLKIYHRVWALDNFRQGKIANGLSCLEIERDIPDMHVTDYRESPAEFKLGIRKVIATLKEAGL